jgi:hypothetical protein
VSLFKSFQNVPILDDRPPTQEEMAADLAMETIEHILNRREEAKQREIDCEPPLEATEEDQQAYATLDALMQGRHRHIVAPLILEAFPELITPAKLGDEAEQAEAGKP